MFINSCLNSSVLFFFLRRDHTKMISMIPLSYSCCHRSCCLILGLLVAASKLPLTSLIEYFGWQFRDIFGEFVCLFKKCFFHRLGFWVSFDKTHSWSAFTSFRIIHKNSIENTLFIRSSTSWIEYKTSSQRFRFKALCVLLGSFEIVTISNHIFYLLFKRS